MMTLHIRYIFQYNFKRFFKGAKEFAPLICIFSISLIRPINKHGIGPDPAHGLSGTIFEVLSTFLIRRCG